MDPAPGYAALIALEAVRRHLDAAFVREQVWCRLQREDSRQRRLLAWQDDWQQLAEEITEQREHMQAQAAQ